MIRLATAGAELTGRTAVDAGGEIKTLNSQIKGTK